MNLGLSDQCVSHHDYAGLAVLTNLTNDELVNMYQSCCLKMLVTIE